MSEIIRPIMYGARHPLWFEGREGVSDTGESLQAIVVGHSCESSDLLTVDDRRIPLYCAVSRHIQSGDRVLIGGVGAYCSSMRTVHYNSYPRIAEYLLEDDGSWTCLKPAEHMEEVRKGEL